MERNWIRLATADCQSWRQSVSVLSIGSIGPMVNWSIRLVWRLVSKSIHQSQLPESEKKRKSWLEKIHMQMLEGRKEGSEEVGKQGCSCSRTAWHAASAYVIGRCMVQPSSAAPSPARQLNCQFPFWFWFAARRQWRNKNSPHNKLKETFGSRILPMQDETVTVASGNWQLRPQKDVPNQFQIVKGCHEHCCGRTCVCVWSGCRPMNRLARLVTAADSGIDGPINLHTKRQVSVLNVNFACLMNSLSMQATRRGPASNLTQLPVPSSSRNQCSNPPPFFPSTLLIPFVLFSPVAIIPASCFSPCNHVENISWAGNNIKPDWQIPCKLYAYGSSSRVSVDVVWLQFNSNQICVIYSITLIDSIASKTTLI